MVLPSVLLIVIAGGAVGVALRAAVVVPLVGFLPPPRRAAATCPSIFWARSCSGSSWGGSPTTPRGCAPFLGTGVMGGFTTYSAFAVQSVTVSSASPLIGLVLIAVSLLGGGWSLQ
ncbi:MAG: CrcB family protein [Microbacterium sp.]